MNTFQRDIEAQFEKFGREVKQFFDKLNLDSECTSPFYPAADMIEHDEHVHIIIDVPGMDKSDLHISLKDSVITIKGERLITYDASAKVRRQERAAGSFSRSFPVPEGTSASDIKARFNQGVLTIEVPRGEATGDSSNITIE
jgi:HSP20 family protein